ncbi:hypothetical protein PR048_030080 [Dryococelus australis]|uniref:Uncharacterized protein n=1 Tax=Dryococelus australis TaxID=614101 RepID=A0ABQ9GAN6_9NEOP|nr:hypothetical protein PR048_030080 [Dryococelus australis]
MYLARSGTRNLHLSDASSVGRLCAALLEVNALSGECIKIIARAFNRWDALMANVTTQNTLLSRKEKPKVKILRKNSCDGNSDSTVINASFVTSSPERVGGGKREYPEKTLRKTTSSSKIPTCDNPGVNSTGIGPGSQWWEESALATAPPLPFPQRWPLVRPVRQLGLAPGRNFGARGTEAHYIPHRYRERAILSERVQRRFNSVSQLEEYSFERALFRTTWRERCFAPSHLGSPLDDDRPIMNAVKYKVVSGVVWTNRTMVSSITDTNRTGVLAVLDIYSMNRGVSTAHQVRGISRFLHDTRRKHTQPGFQHCPISREQSTAQIVHTSHTSTDILARPFSRLIQAADRRVKATTQRRFAKLTEDDPCSLVQTSRPLAVCSSLRKATTILRVGCGTGCELWALRNELGRTMHKPSVTQLLHAEQECVGGHLYLYSIGGEAMLHSPAPRKIVSFWLLKLTATNKHTAIRRRIMDFRTIFQYHCSVPNTVVGRNDSQRKYHLGSPLVDCQLIVNAVKYKVMFGVVWTNRTMVSPNTDSNRTGVLTVVDIDYSPSTLANRVRSLAAGSLRHRAGFLGDLPYFPVLHFGAVPYPPQFTIVGCQGLDTERAAYHKGRRRTRRSTHRSSSLADAEKIMFIHLSRRKVFVITITFSQNNMELPRTFYKAPNSRNATENRCRSTLPGLPRASEPAFEPNTCRDRRCCCDVTHRFTSEFRKPLGDTVPLFPYVTSTA